MNSSPSRRSWIWRAQIGLGDSPEELASRRETFERFLHEYPFPQDPDDELAGDGASGTNHNNLHESNAAPTAGDLDPLTAMMLEEQALAQQQEEMDLAYRRDLARRKRGQYSQDGDSLIEDEDYDRNLAALQIIDKDLHRLAHPTGSNEETDSSARRKEILRRILYVYNCRHESIGYRQGMHEIASWLLWALECDCCETKDTTRMDYSALAGECFAMTEAILTDIQPAYDVGEHKPMEQMSLRVVDLVAKADYQLRHRLDHLGIPPAIYLTKWIRLLFSREVVDVMGMWDAMFQAKQDGFAWMMILEATAAARILQHRQAILLSGDDGLLHLLMNMPPEEHLEPLLEFLQPLLRGDTIVLPVIELPPAVPNPRSDPLAPRAEGAVPNPLFTAQAVGSLAAHLTGVKESIAAQTQSISKRLMQEWEAIQAENQATQQRSYDDGFWNQSLLAQANALDSPSRRVVDSHSSPRQQHQGSQQSTGLAAAAPSSSSSSLTPRSGFPPHTWAFEMEYRLGVLQNFVMLSEQHQRGSVPPSVWEALADLEEIRQSILRTHNAT